MFKPEFVKFNWKKMRDHHNEISRPNTTLQDLERMKIGEDLKNFKMLMDMQNSIK